MLRALFEKTGNAVYISHLDLMRLFQRAFKRAGLLLTHTQGYSPKPSVSIALPMSVGIESRCELLDFDLEGETVSCQEIKERLNQALVEGVRVLAVYETDSKVKDIAFLDCTILLEYQQGIPENGEEKLRQLFSEPSLTMEKRNRNGVTEQNIISLIRSLRILRVDDNTLRLDTRICCQNPALNPALITGAVEKYLPAYKPDFARYTRNEIFLLDETVFR